MEATTKLKWWGNINRLVSYHLVQTTKYQIPIRELNKKLKKIVIIIGACCAHESNLRNVQLPKHPNHYPEQLLYQ